MFGKKEKPKRPNRTAGGIGQYGLFDVPDNLVDFESGFMNDDGDDDDLEAELAALTVGDDDDRRNRRKVSRKPVPDAKLEAMVAESMKDINPDEEVSDGEDDPELLSELKFITGDESPEKTSPVEEESPVTDNVDSEKNEETILSCIKLMEERLTIYQNAESKAKQENELGRARRYNRGIKTLQELLHNARAGKNIDESEIPPALPPSATAESAKRVEEDTDPVAEDVAAPTAESENASESGKVIDQEALELLKNRQQEYKAAAVAWKRAGNMKEALHHVNVAKQFDIVIAALNAGEAIDLSDMPPQPTTPGSVATSAMPQSPEKEESETQQQSLPESSSAETERAQPSGPENLEMALKERLEVYRRTRTAAESEGNNSKVRRYDRICKQFQDALKLHARGKPVPLDELPTPPGFPPLSAPSQPNTSSDVAKQEKPTEPAPQASSEPQPSENKVKPTSPKVSTPPKVPTPPSRTQGGKKPNQKVTSRAEKQMILLQQRQRELKQAALAAKKDGDLELARDYLRQAKGIQPLIEASQGGLPVDMSSIPLSPLAKIELDAHGLTGQSDDTFTLVSGEDCVEDETGTAEQIYENLESQLVKQIKWCLSTRDHSKALGDVPGYNRWERLAFGYTRDLDMLRVRKRDSLPPPLHHYETKTYAIVQSCTDLSDADVEISIIRGVNYSKDADTYVMFEFPYPSDSPPTDRTATIKASSNPEYQAVFPLTGIIERTSRQCQRAFKRHALKCQVWAKGGFFRSDSLLGTVTVKLQPLETQCTLHDSFPLMEGRKATGGKLELKVRLRNPILTKQIEQITDRWLTIDH